MWKWMFVYVVILLKVSLLAVASKDSQNSVEAFSEGSDCRCKCILTSVDGGPCGGLVGGARRTIYTVETVSGGNDCRCSCNTPPPAGCEMPASSSTNDQLDSSAKDFDESAPSKIDLVELHSSISNMVSAMVNLEKSFLEPSVDEENIIKSNVEKVIIDLKSTNGSYRDLMKDLELGSKRTDPKEKLKPTKSSQEKGFREGTESTSHIVQQTTGNIQQLLGSKVVTTIAKDNTGKIIQLIPSLKKVGADDLKSTQSSYVTRNSDSKTTETTTISSKKHKKPVMPEISFVPYRNKPDPELDVSPDEKDATYDYNYEENFDNVDGDFKETTSIPSTSVATTSMKETTAAPRENVQCGVLHLNEIPLVAKIPLHFYQWVEVDPLKINTTANATKQHSTTEADFSYEDHVEQYDNEYDDYDESMYYENDHSFTTKTTPTTTTTTTALPTTTVEKDTCGTLHTLSRPKMISRFGRREGAWMRDPVSSKLHPNGNKKIYIANFYYGDNLIEFKDLEGLKKHQWISSYTLPHKWIGTGHIVYNGSFYYNRAFSRSLIKYNLHYRFVSAWSHLPNAIYDPSTPFTWRGHSMVHMAADEDGLWVIYPSQDPFDSTSKLTYVVNQINPVDLRTLQSFKTNIRQSVSHVFMMCGVVYSTDRYNSRISRVTHAYDTRTMVQKSVYLGFENMFSYTVQFLYNPKERKLYAWDNGRQIQYSVIVIY